MKILTLIARLLLGLVFLVFGLNGFLNFLNMGPLGFTVSDLAGMGVRRISVGGSLARVAMHAFIKTATQIAQEGKFDGFAGLISNADLNKFFSEDRKKF